MNQQNNFLFYPSSLRRTSAPVAQKTPGRVPKDFKEAMTRLPGKAAETPKTTTPLKGILKPILKKPKANSVNKWKSSFKPVGSQDEDEDEDDNKDQSTSSSEKMDLYDPYDPASSDNETEIQQKEDDSPSSSGQNQDNRLNLQQPSNNPLRRSRWDIPSAEAGSMSEGRHDLRIIARSKDDQGSRFSQSLLEHQPCSSHTQSLDQHFYVPLSGDMDHEVHSPDRIAFPSHGEPNNKMADLRRELEYSREVTAEISTPKVLDYKHHSTLVEKGPDPVPSAAEMMRHRSKTVLLDRNPVTCDLCDVELATAHDLEDHLESRVHWGTMEYIQQNNNYDDLVIAFLQEVMTYKSRQCTRAIQESAFQALEENDHMTKMEVFHCSACQVFVSSSAMAVQDHITSREHLSNTELFRAHQRRICLDRAGTIMKELDFQFDLFRKGERAFE